MPTSINAPNAVTVLYAPLTAPQHTSPMFIPRLQTGARSRRRSKIADSEDPFLPREVAAAKAQVAPTGERQGKESIAATRVNATKGVSSLVDWKAIQDMSAKVCSTRTRK